MEEENKLKWCLKQKKGIELIEPNTNLAKSYRLRAKKDLLNLEKQEDIVWRIIISYYVCYNSLYSILIRCGIKSEIHSCSIYLVNLFENLKGYYSFLEELKDQRTNVQYYLKEFENLEINKVKEFLNFCELELDEINTEKINFIRKQLLEIRK